MATIAKIEFLGWRSSSSRKSSFMCQVSYLSGRHVRYYGRVPAPVSRYMREGGLKVYREAIVPYTFQALANWPVGVVDLG